MRWGRIDDDEDVGVEEQVSDAGVAGVKRGRESFWSLGNITAVLALCTFFFGIGTVTDLSHRLFPTRTASDVRKQYVDTARQAYVNLADERCRPAVNNAKASSSMPSPITYDWMMNVLTLRRQMAVSWAVLGPGELSATDAASAADVLKMLSDFRAADAFWAATADNLKAGDVAGYNTNLGLFSSADGSFGDQARRFGFTVCNYQWPSAPPWQ